MKKFLIKFICFLILLTVPLYLLGDICQKRSPIRQEFQYPPEQMPETVDLAVVGSSHALLSIDLSPYSDSYFNFSMTAQTPLYDYAILKEYQDRIADGATVLISFSYMSPFWTETPKQFHDKQTRYYRTLSPENIIDYDASEAFRIKLNQKIPQTRLLNVEFTSLITTLKAAVRDFKAYGFHLPQEESYTPRKIRPGTVQIPPEKEPEDLVDTPEIQALRQLYPDMDFWFDNLPKYEKIIRQDHYGIIEPAFPHMNPAVQQAYDGIFDLARAHNWRLIAVTTPFTKPYNDLFDSEFYQVFYDLEEQLFRENGIEYWDYSHDLRFSNSLELFSDLDHMVPKGMEIFSAILAQRLGLLN